MFFSALSGFATMAGLMLAPFSMTQKSYPENRNVVTYQLVTNEIKAKQQDGTNVEVYRFDPGVVVLLEGQSAELKIRGVKGHDHPVVLEGYGIQGTVHRNQVTTLRFKADKTGVFPLICTAHADAEHNGPMEAYVVVVPRTS